MIPLTSVSCVEMDPENKDGLAGGAPLPSQAVPVNTRVASVPFDPRFSKIIRAPW